MAKLKVAPAKPAGQDIRYKGKHIHYHPVLIAISKAEAAAYLMGELQHGDLKLGGWNRI